LSAGLLIECRIADHVGSLIDCAPLIQRSRQSRIGNQSAIANQESAINQQPTISISNRQPVDPQSAITNPQSEGYRIIAPVALI
jgi:hypothetical protein